LNPCQWKEKTDWGKKVQKQFGNRVSTLGGFGRNRGVRKKHKNSKETPRERGLRYGKRKEGDSYTFELMQGCSIGGNQTRYLIEIKVGKKGQNLGL